MAPFTIKSAFFDLMLSGTLSMRLCSRPAGALCSTRLSGRAHEQPVPPDTRPADAGYRRASALYPWAAG